MTDKAQQRPVPVALWNVSGKVATKLCGGAGGLLSVRVSSEFHQQGAVNSAGLPWGWVLSGAVWE